MKTDEERAWCVLLGLSLFARLAGLGLRALSHDESLHALYSWYWSQGLNYQHDPMMHGPLLFHMNGLLFTFLPVTDFTARLIPALFGTGCVAMMVLYRRWLGRWGAFCAAVLISLDPGHLFYSRYLRNDIYISLFTLLMVWAVLRYRETRRPAFLLWLSLGLALSFVCKEVCFIHGVMLGAGCVLFALIETLQKPPLSLSTFFRHPLIHCAALVLLLALPFITGLLIPGGSWSPPGAIDSDLQTRALRTGIQLIALTWLLGAAYFYWLNAWGTWIKGFVIFWFIQLVFYTTLFTHLSGGSASGLAGSLGYWWAQHDVQRGNPDPAFYLTLLLLYTPVLLLGAGLALRRFRDFPVQFCLFWAVLHFGIYSWAGERMPWLLLHISLPLCLLLGAVLPELFAGKGWRNRCLQGLLVLGLAQLTLNSLRLSGPNAEGPWEPLVYAHSGENLKLALWLAEEHLERHPGTQLQVDPAYSWPTAWYFRETPARYEAMPTPGSVDPQSSVIFVSPSLREDFQAEGWISRMGVDLTTWPRQRYHRIDLNNLKKLWRSPEIRSLFVNYYLTREQPAWREGEFPGPNRFLLMTRNPE
jgi:uncharacterized protein (TIGR03663 family)